ncbi:polyhydroxyalkanoate synthesis repressor PhaR [Piscirickettsia salmonis]|uniref:polyhydroxyalkanoate synthesis repressor PhaR n=1 Tax=Piscirickettsia salmonis TaxID=1238 RepID=UPI0012BA1BA7|nr:polyhydroxyalkanoate synthesis repressor PhaR [Piscirickettsia salmonis]QGP51786.1 polyhydroxyalkanoate synthesis repressor PhaR [Piscirickettsia salmonis]QGP52971.1 polyhydroxyalkanoate synthesis repressor PhaR [Piscirickettsia salmonis]QGP61098.1 polyhydroxyalkanoate synthesis repressor PhaR [Piscirickettsia salmonis]QGP62543.1 polyhydroxyalkanoate synthesis repressor PhaR [Piscirickettsia salmonis]
MSENIRIIKKYPNRRLYDTSISSYITLNDVRQLVVDCVKFQVIDARSKDDLTHTTLLQIINEQEDKGAPMFSTQILENIIRFYGNSMQDFARGYLDRSMALFVEQQNSIKDKVENLVSSTPNPMNMNQQLFSTFSEMAQSNLNMWSEMQKNFQNVAQTQTTVNPTEKEEEN